MFTGLVREIGSISAITRQGGLTRLSLEAPSTAAGLELGDSLAVNGICLTITRTGKTRVDVEAVAETRRITTLGQWRNGDHVHLEPALRAGDPLGGHLVLGHVDGIGRIKRLRREAGGFRMDITAPPEMATWLLPKGSIAIDGVSLTLSTSLPDGSFNVNLIPHTLEGTLFAGKRVGDPVNLEADILAKGAAGHATNLYSGTESQGEAAGLSVQDILAKGFRRSR